PQNAAQRDIERDAEIECKIRLDRKTVKVAHPTAAHTANHVARESRKGVAVGADDGSGLQERLNIAFQPIGEIGGMDAAKGCGRENLLPLAAPGGLPDERGGIPFTECDGVAFRAQPLAQEGKLRRLPRAVNSFDDNQLAVIAIRNKDGHKRRWRWICGQRLIIAYSVSGHVAFFSNRA